MYRKSIDYFANFARDKVKALKRNPGGFFVGSMMAGAYVGFGIILIFVLGSAADPQSKKLIMGTSFGIALTLVVFAGAELFTGHNMYMPLALFKKKITSNDLILVWVTVWVGNLVGSAFVGILFVLGGASGIIDVIDSFVNHVAIDKMNASVVQLLARAMLCNWLVCLALWMAARTNNDTAKCIVIFWCLFGFIASGFEHSVANMTLFSIALLGEHPEAVSLYGAGYNLFWVTIGNLLSGSLFMAGGYWLYSD
jgi:nitrite transporter NirC|tara:strand:- start:1100 stop:1858 length:759 start_codon:yes stop_codon:yes gene_type:complete